ncbi:NUDIX domain-containing protein [Pseudomonas panipatensis]|uniref:ADP-ribose pyrophosphatase YjhB, NUDIX family n=1 Tax=Pseudomonas panipatensis TaxID=428992 RepID=A0A1G8K609_9PSED|nr:NUDIX domain-containing protein [Pseudomonas panipatensis]SDI38852.1 ADP-ribose pyrophosphatase YjhB, NUDIX family [Pseudomonas panipatensis]SMP60757.1 ADP-ribose pyrophosphatase YjhB, NUDIX family [Pseudomonas panipatensis]
MNRTPLQHRIRAAGLLVRDERILLVRHEVGDDIYWIPPGGGFESLSDRSTRDTVKRECREETGLEVEVGPLVYVREFAEPLAGRFHLELFYRVDAWRGEISLANLRGLGGDEYQIREVAWVPRGDLPTLASFYPAELLDDVWQRLAVPQPPIRHLGLQP